MRNYLKQIKACILLLGHTLMSCSSPNVAIKEVTSIQEEMNEQQLDKKVILIHEVEQVTSAGITNPVGSTPIINKPQSDQVATTSIIPSSVQLPLQVNQLTPSSSVTIISRSTYSLPTANSPTKKKTNRKGISPTNKFLKSRKELQTRQDAANRSTKIEASSQQNIHAKYANSYNVVGVKKSNASSNTNTSVSSELIEEISSQVFTAKGSHMVTFKWEDGQCIATVEEESSSGIRKNRLPVYLLPDMTWEQLASMNELEQPYRIEEIWGKNGKKDHLIVGTRGLMGGGNIPPHGINSNAPSKLEEPLDSNTVMLRLTVQQGDIEGVRECIRLGADVNRKFPRLGFTYSIHIIESYGKTPLHEAARYNSSDKGIAQLLIDKGANIEAKDNYGETPLHVAAEFGNNEIAQLLIDKNANKEVKDNSGHTPLHKAVFGKQKELVELLISKGANIEAKDNYGETPLHVAAVFGNNEIAQLLVVKGANKEAKNNDGETPLHKAVRIPFNNKERKERVKLFVSAGSNLHTKNNDDLTPIDLASTINHLDCIPKIFEISNINAIGSDGLTHLHRAVRRGDLELVKKLIEAGADLHSKNSAGFTPIDLTSTKNYNHLDYIPEIFEIRNININAIGSDRLTHLQRAIQREDLELAKKLIDSRADKNVKDSTGNTLLHLAIQKGDLPIVKYLVENGADKNVKNYEGKSSVDMALEISNIELSKQLLSALGVNIHDQDSDGNTLLHLYILKENIKCAKQLVALGADLHLKNKTGLTPIDLTSTTRHLDYIQPLFLVEGTNINAKGRDGSTHLHRAIRRADMHLASLLIELKADIKSTDGDNRTPLHLAAEAGHRDLAKQLVEKGANMQARDQKGMTPLHSIAFSAKPCIELAVWLVKKGLDINLIDSQGNTALHLAIEKGHLELAKQLLALGADPYIRNKEGLTPLHVAFQTKQLEWIKQLLQQPGLLPLHWAIRAGDIALVKQLIELKTDLNAIDQIGWTGLHWAAYEGNLTMIKYLIEDAHMPLSLFDKQGKTPLDIAVEKNHIEILGYLQSIMVNLFQGQRSVAQAEIARLFEEDPDKSLASLWKHIGLNIDLLNYNELAGQLLDDIQAATIYRRNIPPFTEDREKEKETSLGVSHLEIS